MPLSSVPGTSGRLSTRVLLKTTSGRSLPSRTIGMADGSEVKMIGVSPAIADVTSCAVPLNGTVVRSRP